MERNDDDDNNHIGSSISGFVGFLKICDANGGNAETFGLPNEIRNFRERGLLKSPNFLLLHNKPFSYSRLRVYLKKKPKSFAAASEMFTLLKQRLSPKIHNNSLHLLSKYDPKTRTTRTSG